MATSVNSMEPTKDVPARGDCDVVIVGGGGAGLAAAVAAASRGMRTVLLEKADDLGGSTALSVGSFTAAGTRLQRRKGIVDSADALLEDMALFLDPALAQRDAPALRAVLAVEAAPTLAWLEELGLSFTGPHREPPHRVPRMHNVVPASRMYTACLHAAAVRYGATVMVRTKAERLLVDKRGRVVGLECSQDGATKQIRAARGVILASGDFNADQEFRHQYLSAPAAAAVPVNPHNTGDGHRMAGAVGAEFCAMGSTFGPSLRFPPPSRKSLVDRFPTWRWLGRLAAGVTTRVPTALLRPLVKSLLVVHMSPSLKLFAEGAILVNLDGDRFCDERKAVVQLAHQRESSGYIILDGEIARKFCRFPYFISTAPGIAHAYFDDYARGRPDIVHRAKDVAALASALALDPARLENAASGAPRPFGSPLYAMGPVRSVSLITEGAVAIDEQCRVLGKDGRPITGLFAAGATGQGGLQLNGHGHHLAWAMTSGRIAGEVAARQLPNWEGEQAWPEA